MAAKRQLLLELLARDSTGPATKGAAENITTVAEAAEGAAKATDKLGDQAKGTVEPVERFGKSNKTAAEHAAGLDHEIKNVEQELRHLAVSFAEAQTAADRTDLSKAIRRTQSDLRQLNRSKSLIKDAIPAVDPKPIQEAVRNVDQLKEHIKQLQVAFLAAGTTTQRSFLSKAISSAESELGNLEKYAKNLAPEVENDLSEGFAGLGGVLGPVLAGVGVAAAPLIAGAISGAVLGAAGAGGVVGGLLLAKRDVRVQAAAKDLSGFIGQELDQAAGPFVPATLAGIEQIRGAFGHMTGDLSAIFSSASRYVGPLISGVTGLIENTLHGVKEAVDKAGPVIDVLAQDLPELGSTVGEVFKELAQDAPAAATALDQVFKVAEVGIVAVGGLLDGLTRTYGFLASTGILGQKAQADWITYSASAKIAAASSDALAGSQKGVAIQTKTAADAVEAQRKALINLDKQERANVDPLLGLLDAQDKVTSSQKAYNDAVKAHGKNSEEARTAARQLTAAALDEGDAVDKVSSSMDGQLTPAMQRTLEKAKLTKPQIAAIKEELDRARTSADKFGQLTPTAHIFANTFGADGPIQHTARLIAGLPKSKHITITVGEAIASAALDLARLLGHRAAGGPVRKGQAYVVGEHRPELFVPDRDGTILPSIDRLTGTSDPTGGGGTRPHAQAQQVTVVFDIRGAETEFGRWFTKAIRTQHGLSATLKQLLG